MNSEVTKIEGVLDQNRLSIRYDDESDAFFICYDHIPLWRTVEPLSEAEIFLYDPKPLKDVAYTLMCRDSFDDLYTYGYWQTLREAKRWLAQPKRLY